MGLNLFLEFIVQVARLTRRAKFSCGSFGALGLGHARLDLAVGFLQWIFQVHLVMDSDILAPAVGMPILDCLAGW